MGGKTAISKEISEIINKNAGPDKTFVSLFCGACSVESRVDGFKKVILNDKHPYLISTLKAIQKGWEPPENISEFEYYQIKNNIDGNPALSGFAGFACSFGGKWFSSYAKCAKGRNYAKDGRNSLLRKMSKLKNVDIFCMDYRDVPIPENSVIYCDPPYKGVTGYKCVGNFDHELFWDYMRVLSKKHTVYISEIQAPDDFKPILEIKKKRTLNNDVQKRFDVYEKLFVLNN